MKISNWDRKNKIYILEQGQLIKSDLMQSCVPDGFFKRFFLGGKIIAFQEDGEWFLIINSKKITQNEILGMEVNFFGFFVSFRLILKCQVIDFKSIEVVEYFARLFDPTYDFFDAQNIFPIWLKNKIFPEPLSEKNKKIIDDINKN